MPTIWKSTFQEPDTSGLMERLLGEMDTKKGRVVRESSEACASNSQAASSVESLAA